MLTRSLAGRWGWVAWALGCGVIFASACSSGDDDSVPAGVGTGDVGNGNKTGKGGSGGGGGSGPSDGGTGQGGGMGEDDPLGPTVEVVSPAAEDNPNGTGVLVADELDVVCKATRSTEKGAKDVEVVAIDMLDARGNVVDTVAGTDDGTGNHTYTGRVITAKVPDNGVIGFRCTAGDGSTPPHTGTATIETFIDHGPSVEFSSPDTEDQPIALSHPLKIVFTVTAAPVAAGDDGASIGDVTMTVRNKEIELAEKNGEYSATVHLDDADFFGTLPEGSVPIIVQATDQRMPVGSVNEVTRHVIVDGSGPVVTITDPPNQSVRGGKVTLTFTAVDDGAGVDPDSVQVALNGVNYRYSATDDDWTQNGDTYTFNFDTTQIETSEVQATIAVTATDLVGNASKDEAIVLYLDNVPPVVDLDPPPIREGVVSSNECSIAFDPVGQYAANDLDTVYRLKKFRAMVWDLTNEGMGQTNFYYSGPNLSAVVLRLQPNPDKGLLLDTNGDGYCDELLNEDDSTPPKALPYQPLTGIKPQGAAWFGTEADDKLASEFPMPDSINPDQMGECKYRDEKMPPRLCPPKNADDMYRVIPWTVDETIPAIYAVGDLKDEACTGIDWEIGQFVKEGWICVAARAEDNTGNIGISRPLRLCYDDGQDPPPSCLDQVADPPPSCRIKNCKLPPAWADDVTFVQH